MVLTLAPLLAMAGGGGALPAGGGTPTVTFRFRDYNRVDHEEVVPITFDVPIPATVLDDIMDRAGLDYGEDTQVYAFWGWFTDQELEDSGRVRATTSTSINAGQRRPTLTTCGSPGFCTRYGFTISEALFDEYEQDDTITLYAVWSIWGDVDDDDKITFDDWLYLAQWVALTPNTHIALPAGNVSRRSPHGLLDDASIIQAYVALFPGITLGRPFCWSTWPADLSPSEPPPDIPPIS